jgi:probable HAF family extracellular repeat protein
MKPNLAKVLVLSMVAASLFVAQPVSTYGSAGELTMIDLGAPDNHMAMVVNKHGQVLVTVAYAEWEYEAWVWKKGTLTGPIPGSYAWLNAMNEDGQVVGWYADCDEDIDGGLICISRALLYGDQGMTDLGTLGGAGSSAFDINKRGQIAGASLTATGEVHACLWENGTVTDLGTLGGPGSYPNWGDSLRSGINKSQRTLNDRGQVVGESNTSEYFYDDGEGVYYYYNHAFLWQDGIMTDLGTLGGKWSSARAINNRGQVVGVSSTSESYTSHAFIWENGTMTDLGIPTGNCSGAEAIGINDLGQVIAYSYVDDSCYKISAFLWENGMLTDLGTLGGPMAYPHAISEHGQIVGESKIGDWGPVHAFLWENGTMTDLTPTDTSESCAIDINKNGEIAGYRVIYDLANPDMPFPRAVIWKK